MHRVVMLFTTLALVAANATVAFAASDHATDIDPRLEGYPALTIAIHPDRIEVPAAMAPGRTLVVQENNTDAAAVLFALRVPDEITDEQIAADIAAAATVPITPPGWMVEGRFVGTPAFAAPGGGTAVALVDLVPGRYLTMDPFRPQNPARFEVVAMPRSSAPTAAPEADATVELFEMGFTLPAEIRSGRQVWEVTNTGASIHELAFAPVPAGATVEEAVIALGAAITGAATDGQLGPAWNDWEYELTNGVGVISAGGTIWGQFDLAPGTYAVVCFAPGANGPHLMDGMIRIVTVVSGGPATLAL